MRPTRQRANNATLSQPHVDLFGLFATTRRPDRGRRAGTTHTGPDTPKATTWAQRPRYVLRRPSSICVAHVSPAQAPSAHGFPRHATCSAGPDHCKHRELPPPSPLVTYGAPRLTSSSPAGGGDAGPLYFPGGDARKSGGAGVTVGVQSLRSGRTKQIFQDRLIARTRCVEGTHDSHAEASASADVHVTGLCLFVCLGMPSARCRRRPAPMHVTRFQPVFLPFTPPVSIDFPLTSVSLCMPRSLLTLLSMLYRLPCSR